MQKRQTKERMDPPSDPSGVNKDLAQGLSSDHNKVDEIICQHSESPQEAISTMGWISASILHDLRNPLGTICAGAELLMDLDSTSTQVKRLAGNMSRAAGRMRELLAELAGLARDNVSTPEICDIRQVIAAAAEAALAAMGHASIQILLDVPTGIDLPLVRSHIGARKAGACVLVALEDTGPGIPACIRDRLFEPFITSGKQNGLGLGLALARQTVRNHGGDIWTEPAAGGHFVIGLPLDQTCCGLGWAASSKNVGQAGR